MLVVFISLLFFWFCVVISFVFISFFGVISVLVSLIVDFNSLLSLVIIFSLLSIVCDVVVSMVCFSIEVIVVVFVSVADIATERLDEAPVELRRLPYAGPILVGTRMPKDGDEVLSSIESSIQGVEPSARPGWWQDYELSRDTVRGRMKKISALESKVNSDEKTQLFEAVKNTGLSKDQLYYLPLVSKKSLDDWVVLLNERADIVGYAPVGGFR